VYLLFGSTQLEREVLVRPSSRSKLTTRLFLPSFRLPRRLHHPSRLLLLPTSLSRPSRSPRRRTLSHLLVPRRSRTKDRTPSIQTPSLLDDESHRFRTLHCRVGGAGLDSNTTYLYLWTQALLLFFLMP